MAVPFFIPAAALSASFSAPSTVNLSWPAANNGNTTFLYYRIDYSTDPGFSSYSSSQVNTNAAGTSPLSMSIGGLPYNSTIYFRLVGVNAHGSTGYLTNSVWIPTIPNPPQPLTLVGTVPSTVQASLNIDWNGGAALTWFEMQYSTNADFSGATLVGGGSSAFTVTDVTPGTVTYFRGRSYNSQGVSGWSTPSSIQLLSGPRIKVAGVYRTTVCYVKVAGVWRVAVPYAKSSGVWRVAGG